MTQFYLAVGEMKAAESELRAAIFGAQELGLPHQVERAVRLAENAHLDDLVRMGKAAIEEMSDPL